MHNAIIKRRSLLKQLGAAAFLAAPVFRSVISEAQAAFPLRLILLNIPGGIPHKGGPGANDGPDFEFTTQAKPFLPLQSDMIIVDGADQPAAKMVSAYFELEGHGGGCRTMFGGKGEGQGCSGPASCGDESLAYHYGTATSIDLWDKGQQGDHAECFFLNGQPVRPMSDPLAAFMRLFGNGAPAAMPSGSGTPTVDPALLNEYYRGKSRLDKLTAEIGAVKLLAGSAEQIKLDAHLAALRELEKSLPNITGASQGPVGASCQVPAKPAVMLLDAKHESYPMELPETSAAFNKIAYQAINCGLSRVFGLQWLSSGDHLPRFEFMGAKLDHHGLEHGSDPVEYRAVQGWIFEQMAEYLMMLKNTPEGTGSMLDNCVVYCTSEMTEGNHIHSPVFQFVAGKAGGQFTTGRRINASGKTNNDVLLSLVKAMGINATSVGDEKFNGGALSLA